MSELMKESTTTGLTRFSFTVPDCEAIKIEKAIRAILEIVADKQDDEDNKLYSADEVLGPSTPGIILQGFRYREDLTQEQLAVAIGVKQNHISEMERGSRKISRNMAKRFAEFFHTSEKTFL